MSRFLYFREYGKIADVDCSELTLQERLLLSCILTKARNDDKRTLTGILFQNVNMASRTNFIDIDKLVTDVIMKKYGHLFDWIVEHAKDLNTGSKNFKKDRYVVHAISIDIPKCFSKKNGKNSSSLASLAWRAAALAAAASSSSVEEWRKLNIFEWLTNEVTIEKVKKTSKTQLKRSIQAWLETVGITGTFTFDYFIVDPNGHESALTAEEKAAARGWSKPPKKTKKEETKPVEEAIEAKPVAEEAEEAEDELDDAEKEWLDNEKSLSEDENIDGEPSIFKYDSDDLSKYTHEDWKKLYEAKREKHKNMARIITYFRTAWGDINDEVMKIAKKLKVKEAVIKKFIETGYVDDRDGGYEMKQKIRDEIKKLQEHIMMAREDNSWQDKYYPELGNILVAFAHYSHEKLMEVK